MATFASGYTRRRRPSSPTKYPRVYQPTPNFPINSSLLHNHAVKQVPNRSASRTPRPLTPQESHYNAYVLHQNQQPGSPRTAPMQMPRTPQIRPFSPAPSSGVSSVKSLSESESDSDTEMIMMRPSLQIIMQEPETSEDEDEPVDTKLASHNNNRESERESSITIEELSTSVSSPLRSRFQRDGKGWGGEVGVVSIDIEVIKGDYSSALSSDDDDTEAATTTDFPEDDDDDDTFNEWSIDICSSSYPTDAFLLGGFSSLTTEMSGSAFPQMKQAASPSNSGTLGRSSQRPISPRPNVSSRKRSYAWTEDSDSDGDDESDGGSKKSPRKRARKRMTIDSMLDSFADAETGAAELHSSLRRKSGAANKRRRPLSFPGIEGVFHSNAEMDLDY